jgi:probable HAF family extracellular repeat protein
MTACFVSSRGGLIMATVLSALPALAQTSSSSETRYVITDIGTFEGAGTEAYAINRYGQVVGRAPVAAPDHPYAFHWQAGQLVDLGLTVHFHHDYNTYRGEAFDISDGDQIVGGGWIKIKFLEETIYIYQAFILRPATATDLDTPYPGNLHTNLGTLDPNGFNSGATAVSNRNHVVGWADIGFNTNVHAFLVTPVNGQWYRDANADGVNDLLIDLGTLFGTNGDSAATGVNDRGEVVGWSYNGNGDYHGFLIEPLDTNADGVGDTWFRDTSPADGINDLMIDLGTLGGDNSWARGINNFGVIVGEADTSASDTRAFRVVPEDTNGDGAADRWFRDDNADGANDLMQDLGTLGGADSSASRVNANGQIAGWAEDAERNVHGFVWESGQMTNLNTAALASTRWGLNQARDINDSGEIVGFGTYKDAVGETSVRAFKLRVATAQEIAQYGDTDSSGADETVVDSGDESSGDGSTDGAETGGSGGQVSDGLDPISADTSGGDTVAGADESTDPSTPAGLCGVGATYSLALALTGLTLLRRPRSR